MDSITEIHYTGDNEREKRRAYQMSAPIPAAAAAIFQAVLTLLEPLLVALEMLLEVELLDLGDLLMRLKSLRSKDERP